MKIWGMNGGHFSKFWSAIFNTM